MYKSIVVEDDKIEQLYTTRELKKAENFLDPVVFALPENFVEYVDI